MTLHKYLSMLNKREQKTTENEINRKQEHRELAQSSGVFEHHRDGKRQNSLKPGLDHTQQVMNRTPIITCMTKCTSLRSAPQWNELQSSCITSHCRYSRPRETDCMLSLWKIELGIYDCVSRCCFDTRRKTGQCRKLNQVLSFEARAETGKLQLK